MYRGCGLAYPYDWRGFVRAKKKTSEGLSGAEEHATIKKIK
jgi:hypothetical protein